MMLGGKMRGKGLCTSVADFSISERRFRNRKLHNFKKELVITWWCSPRHNFWSPLILKGMGRAGTWECGQYCRLRHNIVGYVTIFVFCHIHMTANVSSAAAVTAVVKQPFRTIVRVAGKFLCQHSSTFLVQKWLKEIGISIRSALVWNITQRREAFPYRRFGTNYWSHIQRPRIPRRISWPLNIWPIVCPETSVSNYHYTLRNIPEERRTYLHHGGTRNRATDIDVGFAQLAACISPAGWFRFSAGNSIRILLSGCTRLRSHRVTYTYVP
jgi:hypothetical protein